MVGVEQGSVVFGDFEERGIVQCLLTTRGYAGRATAQSMS